MALSSSALGHPIIPNSKLNIPVPTPVSEWHGTSMQFAKAYSNNLIQVNSFDKLAMIKERLEKKQETLRKKMILVQARREKQKFNVEVDVQKYVMESKYLQELQAKEDELLRMEQAAIKIQSFIRGYLFRKHNDEIIIILTKKATARLLSDMSSFSETVFYYSGSLPEKAANKIKKAYRNYVRYKKIKRLQIAYDYYAHLKELEARKFLKHIMKNFFAFMRLKDLKYEKYRDEKMREIRERLAILRIKRYWKKKKLSIRILRQKIRRFKRKRLSTLGNRPRGKTLRNKPQDIATCNLYMPSGSPLIDEMPSAGLRSNRVSPDPDSIQESSNTLVIDPNGSTKDLTAEDTKTDDDLRPSSEASSNVEEQEQMRKLILMEEERKRRVEYGYKSYCINKPKVKRVFPLLSERAMSPECSFMDYSPRSPSPQKNWDNDSPIKTAPVPIESSSKKLPYIPKLKYRKKPTNPDSDEPDEPSYMKATESSNRARWDHSLLVAMKEDESTPIVLKKYTGHNFLMHPTISYNMKIQTSHQRNSSEDAAVKKPWRPNTIYNTPYISSVASPAHSLGTPQFFPKPRTTSYLPSPKKPELELTAFENSSRTEIKAQTQPIEISQYLETKANVVTLSFQDALPEISGLLEKYQGSLPPLRPKKPFEIIPLTRNLRYRKNANE